MTTWSLFCSVGLDIQSVAREGCREATQQMHFSQQDALLLPGMPESLSDSQTLRSLFFAASLPCFLGYASLERPVSSVSLTTRPVVTLTPLGTCFCLCVTGCFCLYPAAGHELTMRTQGFSVPITKLWHHHIHHKLIVYKSKHRIHAAQPLGTTSCNFFFLINK